MSTAREKALARMTAAVAGLENSTGARSPRVRERALAELYAAAKAVLALCPTCFGAGCPDCAGIVGNPFEGDE
jgi:hypothetical protein